MEGYAQGDILGLSHGLAVGEKLRDALGDILGWIWSI